MDQLETLGQPSLKHATQLTVDGNVRFEEGVIIKGAVKITNLSEEVLTIPAGVYEDLTITPELFVS